MKILRRMKGVILNPDAEWIAIAAENKSVAALYRDYIAILALIPPFAGFLGGRLFGFGHAGHLSELSLTAGLLRAALQYALSLPLIFVVAFVLSSIAPHFDGESSDRRALALVAYSLTPAWLAELFSFVPGLRWLDVLGFYGVYIFYHGLPRMLKCPKETADMLTLAALVLSIAAGALHAFLVGHAAPWRQL